MRRLLFLVALPVSAMAQVCPPDAETGPSLADQTRATIVAMHPDDSYFSERNALMGQSGVVDGELYSSGGCWFGGSMRLDNGEQRYFYKIAVDAGGASGSWPDCPDDALLSGITRNATYAVLAIHADDSNHHSGEIGPGAVVTVEDVMVNNGGCWWGGTVRTGGGTSLYMYKVALGRHVDACPSGALASAGPLGSPLTITAIHEDAREAMEGVLAEGDAVSAAGLLIRDKECWFSGPLQRADGTVVHGRRVAVVRGGGGHATCPSGRAGEVLSRARTVRVGALHVDDPYAAVSARIVGRTGLTVTGSTPDAGCWHSVDVLTDGGVVLAFEKAALEPVSAP